MIDLSKRFDLTPVDHFELLEVLLNCFGKVNLLSSTTHVYEKQNVPGLLVVSRNQDGTIRRIQAHENFPEAELTSIESEISRCLFHDQVPDIAHSYMFCINKAVQGYFQFDDEFQIAPVPMDAPQAPELMGAHPFQLKLTYTRSADMRIFGIRIEKAMTRLLHELSIHINTHLTYRCFTPFNAWVLEVPTDVEASGWRHLGYSQASLGTSPTLLQGLCTVRSCIELVANDTTLNHFPTMNTSFRYQTTWKNHCVEFGHSRNQKQPDCGVLRHGSFSLNQFRIIRCLQAT